MSKSKLHTFLAQDLKNVNFNTVLKYIVLIIVFILIVYINNNNSVDCYKGDGDAFHVMWFLMVMTTIVVLIVLKKEKNEKYSSTMPTQTSEYSSTMPTQTSEYSSTLSIIDQILNALNENIYLILEIALFSCVIVSLVIFLNKYNKPY